MRPVTVEHVVSQYFAQMPTAGVRGDIKAVGTVAYYVALYGNYQPYGHAGMDFGCPVGTPIRAIADGTVLYAGWSEDLPGAGDVRKWLLYYNFGGIITVIQHDGWISITAHQSDNNAVHVGMKVTRGQIIGLSGDTKTRTTQVAPHVHIEALVYMDYRTRPAEGIIYGRVDPSRFFTEGLAAMGGTTPPSTTTQKEWDEMASPEQIRAEVVSAIREVTKEGYGIVDSVWYRPVNGWNGPVSAEARLAGTDQAVNDIRKQLGAQNAQIAGLVGALAAVNKGEAFDEAKLLAGVKAAAEDGVKNAIESITTTVTVQGGK